MRKLIFLFLIFLLIFGCIDKVKQLDEKKQGKKIENSEETDSNKIDGEKQENLEIIPKNYPSEPKLSNEELSVSIGEPECMEGKVVVKIDFENRSQEEKEYKYYLTEEENLVYPKGIMSLDANRSASRDVVTESKEGKNFCVVGFFENDLVNAGKCFMENPACEFYLDKISSVADNVYFWENKELEPDVNSGIMFNKFREIFQLDDRFENYSLKSQRNVGELKDVWEEIQERTGLNTKRMVRVLNQGKTILQTYSFEIELNGERIGYRPLDARITEIEPGKGVTMLLDKECTFGSQAKVSYNELVKRIAC